jgi:hypothetical protein
MGMTLAARIDHPSPLPEGAPRADEIRQALHRIVGSTTLRSSLRLTRFLTFVVEATLAGQAARIKAYTVAVEALGRSSDFDPQADPIVRVEAGRLRAALARYYSGVGRNDPLLIDLPRGSYAPNFRRRTLGSRARPIDRGRPHWLALGDSPSEPLTEIAACSRQLDQALRAHYELAEINRRQIAAVASEIASARQLLEDARALLQRSEKVGARRRSTR